MDSIKELVTSYWLLSALAAWVTSQITKIIVGVYKTEKTSFLGIVFGNGGMPSTHTAAVVGYTTACAVTEGLGSPLFGLCAILCMIVMNDAVGVRRETAKQSVFLNWIRKNRLSDAENVPDDKLKELIGHTPAQVFVGAAIGVTAALLLSLIPGLAV